MVRVFKIKSGFRFFLDDFLETIAKIEGSKYFFLDGQTNIVYASGNLNKYHCYGTGTLLNVIEQAFHKQAFTKTICKTYKNLPISYDLYKNGLGRYVVEIKKL